PFFVVNAAATAAALRQRTMARGYAPSAVAIVVPPQGFETDETYCQELADTIRAHETTLLVMGVGAPKSELFVYRHRDRVGSCWALCVGDAIAVYVGLAKRP